MSFRNLIDHLAGSQKKIKHRYFHNNYSKKRDRESQKDNDDDITCKMKADVLVFDGVTPI